MSNTDEETRAKVDEILTWFDEPLTHLMNQARRAAIENILVEHADRARRRASGRVLAKDILLYVSLATTVLALLGPELIERWIGQ
ncbi:MAG: hypothetical protein AAF330_04175 [Pseudomonadota bacterium]